MFDPHPSGDPALHYVLITVQAIRILNLVALPVVYLYLRNTGETHSVSDTESQPLLKKNTAPSGSESSTLNGNGYGTTDEATAQDVDESDTASVTSEDSYLERQRKSEEAVSKRLKQDGNWWTYIKGFAVRIQLQSHY